MAVTVQCGLTLAEVAKLEGRGDRGGGGKAVGEVDWVAVLCARAGEKASEGERARMKGAATSPHTSLRFGLTSWANAGVRQPHGAHGLWLVDH